MLRFVYLHGFASSPRSTKARLFAERFAALGLRLELPELDEGNFANLTISGQLAVVERTFAGAPGVILGSSLGGYLAALYAARHPEVTHAILLAPAFGFAKIWAEELGPERVAEWERTGTIPQLHYGLNQEVALGWQLMEDARRYEDEPAVLQPTLIYHGLHDDVVPVELSRNYARTRTSADLREVDSGHELLNVVDEMWAGIAGFLGLGQS